MLLGFATQVSAAPHWVARGLGGTFYVLAGIFFLLTLLPAARPARVCGFALGATLAVEFAQLWHPAWLESIRATRPGALVLGTTFQWADFPYYFLGGALGCIWTRALGRSDAA